MDAILILGLVGIITALSLAIITPVMYGYDLWLRRRSAPEATITWSRNTHKETP